MLLCRRVSALLTRSRCYKARTRKLSNTANNLYEATSEERIRLKRRVRNHVNPFAIVHQEPFMNDKPWHDIFEEPSKQIHLDIGCAKGEYLDILAAASPHWNFIGLEIREDLVPKARARVSRMERPLRNLYFQYGNIMVADQFLADLPGPLARVSVLFPDPWWKRRHEKRRVIQHDNLNILAKYMAPNSTLYFATDVEETWNNGIEVLNSNSNFEIIPDRNWQTDFPDVLTSFHRSFLQKQIHSCAYRLKTKSDSQTNTSDNIKTKSDTS